MKNMKNPPEISPNQPAVGIFNKIWEQHGGRGHYLCPQQKRRTEPQGQGRLRLHKDQDAASEGQELLEAEDRESVRERQRQRERDRESV